MPNDTKQDNKALFNQSNAEKTTEVSFFGFVKNWLKDDKGKDKNKGNEQISDNQQSSDNQQGGQGEQILGTIQHNGKTFQKVIEGRGGQSSGSQVEVRENQGSSVEVRSQEARMESAVNESNDRGVSQTLSNGGEFQEADSSKIQVPSVGKPPETSQVRE